MKGSSLHQGTKLKPDLSQTADAAMTQDPWAAVDEDDVGQSDSWLLSYVDILTLFLVLLVVLLMMQARDRAEGTLRAPEDASLPLVATKETELKPATVAVKEKTPPSFSPVAIVSNPVLAGHAQLKDEPPSITENPGDQRLPSPATLTPSLLPEVADREAEKKDEPIPLAKVLPVDVPTSSWPQPEPLAVTKIRPLVLAKMESGVAPIPAKIKQVKAESSTQILVRRLELDALRQEGVTLSRSATQLRLETRDSVLFERADASLTLSGQQLLQKLAVLLRRHPGEIAVEGHADNRPISTPRFPSNWELSSARAAAVARYLVDQGMDRRRLKVIGFGDTRPLEDNATVAGRAANRRVSLVLELEPDGGEERASTSNHASMM